MAVLRFNNTMLDNIQNNQSSGLTALVALNATVTMSNYPNAILGGPDAGVGLPNRRFNIYTGTMPDFSTFTSVTQRAADLLIAFKTPVYTGTTTGGFLYSDIPSTASVPGGPRFHLGIVGTPQVAAGTGTASWFVMSRSDDLVNGPAIIGSVGLTGSGADLEIPDTNIVTGQSYRSAGFYYFIPVTQSLS